MKKIVLLFALTVLLSSAENSTKDYSVDEIAKSYKYNTKAATKKLKHICLQNEDMEACDMYLTIKLADKKDLMEAYNKNIDIRLVEFNWDDVFNSYGSDPDVVMLVLKNECKKNVQMCEWVGDLYLKKRGKHRDIKEAMKYFEMGCKSGFGCKQLGAIYMTGHNGIKKDGKKAVDYYKKGCDNKDHVSCGLSGDLYVTGKFVKQDREKALELFEKSCNYGSDKYCYDAGRGYTGMLTKNIDYKKAAYYSEKACARQSGKGCFMVGFLYYKGQHYKKDIDKAIEFFDKGCALKDKNSCENAKILRKKTGHKHSS